MLPICYFKTIQVLTACFPLILLVIGPIAIDPYKTSLIIIDIQNFFLGRERGAGHLAEDVLLQKDIHMAKKAGIRVLHLTWGLSEEELQHVPPMVFRDFGFSFTVADSINSF